MNSFFDLKEFFNSDGELDISEIGVKNMYDLCDIIIHKHFFYTPAQVREDLISTGILKMMELLSKGDFDPSRSSLKNYLYTGVRNEMKNYLYRNSKEISVDDDIVLGMNESPVEDANPHVVQVSDTLLEYYRIRLNLTDSDMAKIVSSLSNMGFYGSDERAVYYPECESALALIIWKHLSIERR